MAKSAAQKNASKKTTTKKTATKKAATKKAVKKAGPKGAEKTGKKAVAKAPAAKAKAKPAKAAPKAAGLNIVEEINSALEAAVQMTLEVGDMEVGENGVTEESLEKAVAGLATVRKQAWDLLMTTFPDLIDRLMFTEMIEAAYEGEEAGSIRFAGSAVGWDEIGGQFVILGRTGDVWEGEGKLLEAVMTAESPEMAND